MASTPRTPATTADATGTTASLGSLPKLVVVTPGGGITTAPSSRPQVSETPSTEAVKNTVASIGEGLTHPDKDDRLIEGCTGLGNLVQLRVHPGTPLADVARPADAETQLVPITQFLVTALREESFDPRLVTVDCDDLERRSQQLLRARRLLEAFTPVVGKLDLIVRNLEDGLDVDVRSTYKRLSSLIDVDPLFAQKFARLKTWATRNGQRAAEARRKNFRRDALRIETAPAPAPAVTPPAPPVASPVPAAPAPLAVKTAAPAPAPRARTRRGRRRA